MTDSNFSGDITKLEPNDLFLVNKDLNGDSVHSETFAVRYSDIVQDIQGETGATGPKGEQGDEGPQGEAGTSVKVKGVFNDYDALCDHSNNGGVTHAEGDIYIVGNDYLTTATENTRGNTPGTPYCKSGVPVNTDNCQNNVAYVFAEAATMPGQSNPDGAYVRIGPLTGDKGELGATGPFYDIIQTIDTPDEFRVVYKDSGSTEVQVSDPSLYDPNKYRAVDGITFFSGLPNDTLEGDVRGATGPYYDSVKAVQTMVTKPNPDSAAPGQPDTLEYPSTKLVFSATTGPGGSDPHGVLTPNPYETMDLVGATGSWWWSCWSKR